MTDRSKLYDNPRSKKLSSDEEKVAKKGDVETDDSGTEWQSFGSRGTRKGGDRFKEEDKEGDLDVEGYDKDRTSKDSKATDNPDPNDAKGWRREYWRKKQKPAPEEKPTS